MKKLLNKMLPLIKLVAEIAMTSLWIVTVFKFVMLVIAAAESDIALVESTGEMVCTWAIAAASMTIICNYLESYCDDLEWDDLDVDDDQEYEEE